jgi:predicted amidohydrolase YtcJ
VDFKAALAPMQALMKRATNKVRFSKAVKLFSDGAMFSQAMMMNAPGYLDGHEGEWLMTPEVMSDGVRTYWNEGWQIHMHVNGDAAMDSVLEALQAAQEEKPRFDHRFFMHHVGYHSAAQTNRIVTLGAHASVNPYFLHALGDDYARVGLGPERASQITRCGSLLRAGVKVSFHSDFMMAPPEPLLLAWCAATRKTLSGKVMAPDERLTLMQALRGVTIDAAWALRMEHEVGSIVAGKLADFCVLADDPFELGADGLKDVRVAGTVFEGVPHMLPNPVPSSIATLAQMHADSAAVNKGARNSLYKMVATACCGATDRCDIARLWGAWLSDARRRLATA